MDGPMESTKYSTMHNRSAIQVRGMSYISVSKKAIFRKYEKIFHDIVVRVFQNAQKSKDLRGWLAKYVVIHN